MNGFNACRFYLSIKTHFTYPKFNVFETKSNIRYPLDKYLLRNDYSIFEKLANIYNDKDFIRYVASNFMYSNPNFLYDTSLAVQNFQEYLKRKESISNVFKNDLEKVMDNGGLSFENIVHLYLNKKITIETVRILDDIKNVLEVPGSSSLIDFLYQDLLRIRKSKGFVIYNSERINNIFSQLQEDQ